MKAPVPDFARTPLQMDRAPDLVPLGNALREAGYTEESVAGCVLLEGTDKALDLQAALARTAEPTPLHTLVRLFVLAQPVSEAQARKALGAMDCAALEKIGLFVPAEGGFRSTICLMPSEGLVLARDFWPDYSPDATPHDFVLGVGPASRDVAYMTVRQPVGRALDLGTGMGIQALLAAPHAGEVIGTDTNPRALNFALLNANLNGMTNVAFRGGNMFEPVDGEMFDLVVSNPPFVISPSSDYEYRDSGMPGDEISRGVIQGAAARLNDGGFATVLFNWYHSEREGWRDRPEAWLRELGCDAWLACSGTTDYVTYAAAWLRTEEHGGPERYRRLLREWLGYYEGLGGRWISTGVMILRRRHAGTRWFRADKTPPRRRDESCSGQILRVFAAEDLLSGIRDDSELLAVTFSLTPDHELRHTLAAEQGKWRVQHAELSQASGLGYTGRVDRLVETVLAGCDGTRPLSALVHELARSVGAHDDQVGPPCARVIRKLLENGFLEVADDPRGTG
jgi:methylase of polypeptide subunit release factors